MIPLILGAASLAMGAWSQSQQKKAQEEQMRKQNQLLAMSTRDNRYAEDTNRFNDYNYQGNNFNSFSFKNGGRLNGVTRDNTNIQNNQIGKKRLVDISLDIDNLSDIEFSSKYGFSKHKWLYENNQEYQQYVNKNAKQNAKDYGTVDLPSTDLRRKDVTLPDQDWMYPNITNRELKKTQNDKTNEIVGSVAPIPLPKIISNNRFKPSSEMMYRGIGKEGMKDAIESGVFRAKVGGGKLMTDVTSDGRRISLKKTFNDVYYAPPEKFYVVKNYAKDYVAEVPKSSAEFKLKFSSRNPWSQYTNKQIPINEGSILRRTWTGNYKPVSIKPQEFANGGLLDVAPGVQVGVNSKGGLSGTHETNDNVFFKNSKGQSVSIEPNETKVLVGETPIALSNRKHKGSNTSFSQDFLDNKTKSISLLEASKGVMTRPERNLLLRESQITNAKAMVNIPKQERYNEKNGLGNEGQFGDGGDLNWLSTPRHELLANQELNPLFDNPEIQANWFEYGDRKTEDGLNYEFEKERAKWISDNKDNVLRRNYNDKMLTLQGELQGNKYKPKPESFWINPKDRVDPFNRTAYQYGKQKLNQPVETSNIVTTPSNISPIKSDIINTRIKQGFDMTMPSIKNSQIKSGRPMGRFNNRLFNSPILSDEWSGKNDFNKEMVSNLIIKDIESKNNYNITLDAPTGNYKTSDPRQSTTNLYAEKGERLLKDSTIKTSNPNKELYSSLIDNAANLGLTLYDAFSKPLPRPGLQLTPTPSVRRVNPYGQLGQISDDVSKAMNDTTLSTSNSQVARKAKQQLLMAGQSAKNKYLSDVENQNIGIDNRYSELTSNINMNNTNAINQHRLSGYAEDRARLDNTLSSISANVSDAGNNYTNFLNNREARALDLRKTGMLLGGSNPRYGARIAASGSETFDEFKNLVSTLGFSESELKEMWKQYGKK